MRFFAAVLAVLVTMPVGAQIQSRPTDRPIVTAENEEWYRLREPIQFAGDVYYPAGAMVFFDGNTMARTGHYNGVPLYADATIEPYSIVLVPVSRGLMQPYERRRQGDLAGTTGSRTPAFPVRMLPDAAPRPQTAIPPTAPAVPIGAINSFTPDTSAPAPVPPRDSAPLGTVEFAGLRPQEQPIVTLLKPENNDGLWIRYQGSKWLSAGPAVVLDASEFVRVGEYAGFPVFTKQGQGEVIYLPTRAGLIAPYRIKD